MAIAIATAWEIRSGGNDTNGGAFVAGAAGTDYSMQAGKNTVGSNISATDAVMNGTTTLTSATAAFTSEIVGNVIYCAGGTKTSSIDVTDIVTTAASTNISSATAAWNANSVGLVIYISGGTGSLVSESYKITTYTSATAVVLNRAVVSTGTEATGTHAGWYQVATYTNATTVVLDRAGVNGTGMALNIGGCFASLEPALTTHAAGNQIWAKNDTTYVVTKTLWGTTSTSVTATSYPAARICGYGTTRGDTGRATIQASTTANLTMLKMNVFGYLIENLIFDGNAVAGSICVACTCTWFYNCRFTNWRSSAVLQTGTSGLFMTFCEIDNGAAASLCGLYLSADYNTVTNCYIHDCAMSGSSQMIYSPGAGSCFDRNIIVNCSGASTDGIMCSGTGAGRPHSITNNIVHGMGRHGINCSTGGQAIANQIQGNILTNNGGYGVLFANAAGSRARPWWDGNVYWNNTSGTRGNGDDTGTVLKGNSIGIYTNIYDVILAGSPYVDAANLNFQLSNNQYGNACRNVRPPFTWPGMTGTTAAHVSMGPIGYIPDGFAG